MERNLELEPSLMSILEVSIGMKGRKEMNFLLDFGYRLLDFDPFKTQLIN